MEKIRLQSSEEQEKYKFIIENTVIEVNRVLQNWKQMNKVVSYENKISLFRSYLARFTKLKYSWIRYNSDVKRFDPLCTIVDWQLIDIDLESGSRIYNSSNTPLLNGLKQFIKEFDFTKFNDLNSLDNFTTPGTGNFDIILNKNYENIKNIKFN